MRVVMTMLMLMLLSGCGDTTNVVTPAAAPESASHNLRVQASYFYIYSTVTPLVTVNGVVTQYTRNYNLHAFVNYSGNPEGAKMTMYRSDNLKFFVTPIVTTLKQLFVSMPIYRSEISVFRNYEYMVGVLTDPHGNDSNWFYMALLPL